jgi:hypothetical protein
MAWQTRALVIANRTADSDQLLEALEVDGRLAPDSDPIVAAHEAWDPNAMDEIIVCTLPTGVSKWLQVDLPHRVAKLTDAPVTHVIAHEAQPAPAHG